MFYFPLTIDQDSAIFSKTHSSRTIIIRISHLLMGVVLFVGACTSAISQVKTQSHMLTDRTNFVDDLADTTGGSRLPISPNTGRSILIPTRVVPFELAYGRPVVKVMVNGRGPFRFVVDTGTSTEAIVTPELAQELDLPSAGRTSLDDSSEQGRQSVEMVSIRSLQVAGVDFAGPKALVHELLKGDSPYDGLLGFVLFREFLLNLDFPKREMSLTKGALQPDGDASVLRFRMQNGLPIISLRVGAICIDAQVDSGGTGLSLPAKLASQLNYSIGPVSFAEGQTVLRKFEIKGARLATDVQFGRNKFPQPFVEINDALPIANFGSSPMQDFAITFDQRNSLVRFEARKKSHILTVTPMPIRAVGI